MSKVFQFNLNQYISVKLTDEGYQRLADLHNQYVGTIKNWQSRDIDYYKNQANKDGYTKFQMWQFLQKFGPVSSVGMAQYYNLNVLIDSKDLWPYQK